MASWNSLLSEEQLLCPICLEVFTRPVSTPCGHNFCMSCIMTYWNKTPLCQCPVCKDPFYVRPRLKVNTFISELTSQFLSLPASAEQTRSSGGAAWPGGAALLCDACADLPQQEAARCCELHLEPHRRRGDPLVGLEERVCLTHARVKTQFCKKDMSLLCDVCAAAHGPRSIVSIAQAHEEMRVLLVKIQSRAQQMIQERLQKIGAVRESVNGSVAKSKDVTRKSLQDLVVLVLKIQSSISELTEELERKQKVTEEEAPALISSMEAEVAALREASGKLEELQQTKDPFQFLKNFQNKSALPPTNDAAAAVFSRLAEAEKAWRSVSKSVSLLRQLLHATVIRLTLCSSYLQTAARSAAQAPPPLA